MLNCEGCKAIQFCQEQAATSMQHALEADSQARIAENQGLTMEMEAAAAEEAAANGTGSEYHARLVRHWANEVAANNQRPEVTSAPLRADFHCQDAQISQQEAVAIRTACTGLDKLRANLGHLVGKQTCGSTAPEAQVALSLADTKYGNYSPIGIYDNIDPNDPLSL